MKQNIFILLIITILFSPYISSSKNISNRLINKNQSTLSSDTISYIYKNDTIIQSVKIFIMKRRINFIIETKNTKRNKYVKLKGVAYKVVSENAGMIEDEDGFAYFVDIYQYKQGDCWLYINIDNEKYDKLFIDASHECRQIGNSLAPIGSLGLLKKQ